jgi:hypothetical protein
MQNSVALLHRLRGAAAHFPLMIQATAGIRMDHLESSNAISDAGESSSLTASLAELLRRSSLRGPGDV